LGAVVALMIATIAAVFVNYRNMTKGQENPLAELSGNAGISIGEVHHTATKDGKTEWRLDAETASYAPGRQEVTFNRLTVVFYAEDDREIKLTADRGVLKKDTNDIEVTGNVLVMDDRFSLKTERLDYSHGEKVISTSEPVRVKSESWDLEADSMSMDIDTRRTTFEGKVRGIFNDAFL
jgi:LPS export ABC transporter protein LptC